MAEHQAEDGHGMAPDDLDPTAIAALAEELAGQVFAARLVALNNSGVAGTTFLGLQGDALAVHLQADGLEPDQIHIQHIHGRLDEHGNPIDSVTPTIAQDLDGDGFVELGEGVGSYGPILLNLASPPDAGLEGFPTAPEGRIDFSEVYDLADLPEGFDGSVVTPLDLREIVVHGLSVPEGAGAGTEGEIDGTGGFKLVLPAAAGEIEAATLVYTADLNALNNSGVSGRVTLFQTGDQLTVRVEASGLEPDQPHVQHIHGRLDEDGRPLDSNSPTLAQDTDGDGFVELGEGVPSYGPILLELSSPPGGELADFPTAPDGTISFEQTYDLSDPESLPDGIGRDALGALSLREIVIHGLSVPDGPGAGTEGEIDGTGGYKAVLPVASGEISFAGLLAPGFDAGLVTAEDEGFLSPEEILALFDLFEDGAEPDEDMMAMPEPDAMSGADHGMAGGDDHLLA